MLFLLLICTYMYMQLYYIVINSESAISIWFISNHVSYQQHSVMINTSFSTVYDGNLAHLDHVQTNIDTLIHTYPLAHYKCIISTPTYLFSIFMARRAIPFHGVESIYIFLCHLREYVLYT